MRSWETPNYFRIQIYESSVKYNKSVIRKL